MRRNEEKEDKRQHFADLEWFISLLKLIKTTRNSKFLSNRWSQTSCHKTVNGQRRQRAATRSRWRKSCGVCREEPEQDGQARMAGEQAKGSHFF